MEQKGLKVNMGKTKVMNCKVRLGQAAGRELSQICMWNLYERCWKILNILHKMQEVGGFTKSVVGFGVDWKL